MEIVICPDHNYIMPYGIMLKSLVSTNHYPINCHAIIDNSVTEDDKRMLQSIFELGENKIYFYSDSVFSDYKYPILPHSRFTKNTFYRLYIASLLPSNINKVLYIDGDIIIRKDITSLWNTNLEGYAAACVTDQRFDIQNFNRLGYSCNDGYYNAGVMLINLEYWRKEGVESQFNDFMFSNPEKIHIVDQDVSNFVLRKKILFLNLKYNVQEEFFWKREYSYMDLYRYGEEIEEAIRDPYIVHYTGAFKPWHKGCRHPLKEYFTQCLNDSPWSHYRPHNNLPVSARFLMWLETTARKILGKNIMRFREDIKITPQ